MQEFERKVGWDSVKSKIGAIIAGLLRDELGLYKDQLF
jgi:hypothetical protein